MLTRTAGSSRWRVLLLAIGLLAFVGGAWTITKFTVDNLLYRDAVSSGYEWANYLARNIGDLEEIVSGSRPSAASMDVFAKSQQLGRVFRYKIFDPHGNLKLVSDERKVLDADTQNLAEHNPIAARAIATGRPLVVTKEGNPPGRPPFFSEAYIPVAVAGKMTGIIEAYVDQTEKRKDFQYAFLAAAASLSLLTALAFGAPAIAWYRRTKEKQRAEAQIRFLAYHDTMTGLPSRNYLVEQLHKVIDGLSASDSRAAVHYIDVDHFKNINDTLGHDAGDMLIKLTADRLRALAGPDDIVARLGGDEFAVLQTKLTDQREAERLARRIVDMVAKPYMLNGHEVSVTASVGVAVAPADGGNAVRLMKSADLALYGSKADGRNCTRFFAPYMDADLEARLSLEKIIREAVVKDGFDLHFQPAINAADLRLVGFEALIRLRSTNGSLISPAAFIPVAEEMGLIGEIGAWVIRQACLTAAAWPESLKVAVNLSPAQFADGKICDVVAGALAASSLAPHRLELEITEGLLLTDTEAVMMQLRQLKALGVGIVMDDFGTGYSSLSYLWRFPFDKIKIDRTFMRALETGDHSSAEMIVSTIIGLGHSLQVTVTVEGVENERQAQFVRDAKCDQIQGFYFSRPLPATELAGMMLEHFQNQSNSGAAMPAGPRWNKSSAAGGLSLPASGGAVRACAGAAHSA